MAEFFTVVPADQRLPNSRNESAYLLVDNWDDWFAYSTMYTLIVMDASGEKQHIGSVKIGQVGMRPDQRRPDLEPSFDVLGEEFFSVGQDDTYYERLNKLGVALRDRVLTGLRDMAFDPRLLERALKEKVTGVSLLRSVTRATVQGQYARLAQGGGALIAFQLLVFWPAKGAFESCANQADLCRQARVDATQQYPCPHWPQRRRQDLFAK